MAILPSAESATDVPWLALLTPTSFSPSCVQLLPLRLKTHAAPAAPSPKGTDGSHILSLGPPTIAVLPSAERATDHPWFEPPTAPLPTSFLPCCVHTPRLRLNTQAAPVLLLSDHPPTMAVLPSADRARDIPRCARPTAPSPTSLPSCVHTPLPFRVNTHAASAPQPPTRAVLPSADKATAIPWPGGDCDSPTRYESVPTSLSPCCVQAPSVRVNTQAAPLVLLSLGPPTMAVLPSADRATDAPWDHRPPPYSLVAPTSLLPCCVQMPWLCVNTHAAPAEPTKGDRPRSALWGPGPPTMAVPPSADSATDIPWLVLSNARLVATLASCCTTCANPSASRSTATWGACLAKASERESEARGETVCGAKYRPSASLKPEAAACFS